MVKFNSGCCLFKRSTVKSILRVFGFIGLVEIVSLEKNSFTKSLIEKVSPNHSQGVYMGVALHNLVHMLIFFGHTNLNIIPNIIGFPNFPKLVSSHFGGNVFPLNILCVYFRRKMIQVTYCLIHDNLNRRGFCIKLNH